MIQLKKSKEITEDAFKSFFSIGKLNRQLSDPISQFTAGNSQAPARKQLFDTGLSHVQLVASWKSSAGSSCFAGSPAVKYLHPTVANPYIWHPRKKLLKASSELNINILGLYLVYTYICVHRYVFNIFIYLIRSFGLVHTMYDATCTWNVVAEIRRPRLRHPRIAGLLRYMTTCQFDAQNVSGILNWRALLFEEIRRRLGVYSIGFKMSSPIYLTR